MAAPGSFIGNYRILSPLSYGSISSIYVADHLSSSLVAVVVWSGLSLPPGKEQVRFGQLAKTGVLEQNGHRFAILESGCENGAPFIVTQYSQESFLHLESKIRFIDQALQDTITQFPGNSEALVDRHLSLLGVEASQETQQSVFADRTVPFTVTPPAAGPSSTAGQTKTARQPRARKWPLRVALLLVLIVVLAGGAFALVTFLPAQTATVTITPVSKRFTHTYSIGIVPNNPGSQQVQGHTITYTTPPQSQTANATGQGGHAATKATGTVTLSQIHFTNPSASGEVAASIIISNSGVKILIHSFSAGEGATVTVNAEAVNAGSAGNIPAGDLTGPVEIIDQRTQATDGTAYLTDPQPFTGGTDANTYTIVSQSDIDGIANPLVAQLTSSAQTQAQQQVHSGDLIAQAITCTPKTTSDHQAKDAASNVTVTVSVTCSGESYTEQDVKNSAIAAQQSDAVATYGKDYVLVGGIVTGTSNLDVPDANGNPRATMSTDGIWVFKLTPELEKQLAQHIAGQSQSNASSWLLQQKGLAKADIKTSGGFIGTALPSSASAIKIMVVNVSGLNATSS